MQYTNRLRLLNFLANVGNNDTDNNPIIILTIPKYEYCIESPKI